MLKILLHIRQTFLDARFDCLVESGKDFRDRSAKDRLVAKRDQQTGDGHRSFVTGDLNF